MDDQRPAHREPGDGEEPRSRIESHSGRRSRWSRLLRLLVLLVLVALGTLAVLSNTARFPSDPELGSTPLEPPQNDPPAEAMVKVLSLERGPDLSSGVLRDALHAIEAQRWPEDGQRLLDAISSAKHPGPEVFRRALLRVGCLPTKNYMLSSTDITYFNLYQNMQLLTLRAIALAQVGEVVGSVNELEELQRRLLTLLRSCAHTFVATKAIEASLWNILQAWGFLLAVPEDKDTGVQARIWPMVRELATRKTPWPDSIRREHQLLAESIAEMPYSWPVFDREATLRIARQVSHRLIKLAESRPAKHALVQFAEEQRYFQQLEAAPRWRTLLHINFLGESMLATSLVVLGGPRTVWNPGRCRAAAQHHLWLLQLQERGRAVHASARPLPDNPFTDKPFDEDLVREDLPLPCNLPLKRDPHLEPAILAKLPPAP